MDIDLNTFAEQNEELDNKASMLFYDIEKLERRYGNKYREHYDYDYFVIDTCGYISLKGSYYWQGSTDEIEYAVTFDQFLSPEEYIKKHEADLIAKAEEARKKVEAQKAKERQKEYEEFLKLKAKFGE